MHSYDYSAEFPQENGLIYLNHAAVAPWPRSTANAIRSFTETNLHRGATDYLDWLKTEKQLRNLAAELLGGVSTNEIALLKSTSEALSIIAYGLDWQSGDEIIITNQEFPSNRIVWESLSRFGVKVILAKLPDPNAQFKADDITEILKGCITSKTKLISISSVQYASGIRCDLENIGKLCREHNLLFCVDAIQSLGAIKFDQKKIQADFVVADGHKWMMGPEGLALCFIKQKHISQLKLHEFGWHMVKERGLYNKTDWVPAEDATRFECGSPNMIGIHALHASLKLISKIGMDHIETSLIKNMSFLIDRLTELQDIEILSPLSAEMRGGILTFRMAGSLSGIDHEILYRRLMSRNIICAHRGGGIRFSPHFYTNNHLLLSAISILKEEIGKLKN
jgi:selenocysteine lyase/cysteine desulfurase